MPTPAPDSVPSSSCGLSARGALIGRPDLERRQRAGERIFCRSRDAQEAETTGEAERRKSSRPPRRGQLSTRPGSVRPPALVLASNPAAIRHRQASRAQRAPTYMMSGRALEAEGSPALRSRALLAHAPFPRPQPELCPQSCTAEAGSPGVGQGRGGPPGPMPALLAALLTATVRTPVISSNCPWFSVHRLRA